MVAAQLSPRSLIRMIWKGKFLILGVWIAIGVLGSVLVMRMRPMYRAETLILVESQKIPDKYVASTVIGDVQDRLATISQEILSTTRLKKIIEDYHLYSAERVKTAFEEVVERMRRDVDVRLEKGWSNNRPGAFRIAYEGSDPMVVASVVNRLASLYIDENLKVREVQAEGTSQFMEAQLNEAKKALDELEAAVSRYKVQHNGELPQQENSIASMLSRLNTELQGTQDAMSRAQQNKVIYDAELNSIESRVVALTARREPPAQGEDPPAVTTLERPAADTQKSTAALAEYLRLLRLRYGDTHPEVRRAKAALAEATTRAESSARPAPETKRPTPSVAAPPPRMVLAPEEARELEQLRQRAATLKAQRAIADREIESGATRRENILREMSNYQAQLKNMPIREQEMAALTRDYEMSKANYRSLLDKKTSADMATEMERRQKAERFMVLDPAQVPEKPFKPKRPILMAMSVVAGLGLGIALALAKEWNRNALLGEWELPAGVAILGRIPRITIELEAEPRKARRQPNKTGEAATTTLALLVGLFLLAHLGPGVL